MFRCTTLQRVSDDRSRMTGRVPISSDEGLLVVDPDRNRLLGIGHTEKFGFQKDTRRPFSRNRPLSQEPSCTPRIYQPGRSASRKKAESRSFYGSSSRRFATTVAANSCFNPRLTLVKQGAIAGLLAVSVEDRS